MTGILSRLAPPEGSRPRERRLGRGPGSGVGKVAARGMKGQKSRKSGNIGKLHFQGGQTPMQRRLPKRGFNVPFPVRTAIVNVGALDRFEAGSKIDEDSLRQARLVRGAVDRIKFLGEGELSKALKVEGHCFSASAVSKIEAAGGEVQVRAGKGSVPTGKTSAIDDGGAEQQG